MKLLVFLCVGGFLSITHSKSFATDVPNERASFAVDFDTKYAGEYTLNPSPNCQSMRGAATIKVESISNSGNSAIRVRYYDSTQQLINSKIYPFSKSRVTTIATSAATSKKNPNSLLWETNVRNGTTGETGKLFERMTFNEKVVSFDVKKTVDPQGFWSFFQSADVKEETRCNFTKTSVMNEKASDAPARKRAEQRRQVK